MLLLPTDKRSARAYLLKERNALSAIDVANNSAAICYRMLDFILLSGADDILLFYPIGNEPDLLPLATALLRHKKHVYFPISKKDTVSLDFREVTSLDELEVGAYGIKEPPANNPLFSNSTHSVCVVPALSYDANGMRIGYGKGYYDRFLSEFSGISVGIVFSCLMSQSIPTDKYDVPVDVMITEEGVTVVNETKEIVYL